MPNHLPTMTGSERMLAALNRQPVDATPVWFMRQAGRCLAGYRALREQYDILTMTRTPELCARVTLMPVHEFGVDAAVMYADIMLPLTGMGVPFSIDPGVGPLIAAPLRTPADVAALRIVDAEDATPALFEAMRMVRGELGGRTALIGFAGAPYTVASYLVEGRPTKEFAHSKALMYGDPRTWHHLMEVLTEVTIRYLRAQVDAGAQVLQLFDSWVGSLSCEAYEQHVLPYSRRILEDLAGTGVPTIHFGTGATHLLELMATIRTHAISVDWRLSLDEAWRRIGEQRAIQGNLDPGVLLAPWAVVEGEALRVLGHAAGRDGHVFNLGHGVLADTDSDHLRRLVDLVHERTRRPAPAPLAGVVP